MLTTVNSVEEAHPQMRIYLVALSHSRQHMLDCTKLCSNGRTSSRSKSQDLPMKRKNSRDDIFHPHYVQSLVRWKSYRRHHDMPVALSL